MPSSRPTQPRSAPNGNAQADRAPRQAKKACCEWIGDEFSIHRHGRQKNAPPAARIGFKVTGADSYTFRILASKDGSEWSPMMEGKYSRGE